MTALVIVVIALYRGLSFFGRVEKHDLCVRVGCTVVCDYLPIATA